MVWASDSRTHAGSDREKAPEKGLTEALFRAKLSFSFALVAERQTR
ncbi:protein of unknown function [Methylacidimicrobium sp. AP8]|nr:hypothetical protein [Methylacidimicrobium sp. AP8]CAB4243892.1 protein of unknown function [Methylacidimicrobium sp. AP8]